MSFLLFQSSVAVYFLCFSAYLVFFITHKPPIRRVGRAIFLVAFLIHTVNILARSIEAGHTPITSHHETVSFFAWSVSCCYLSFRWRYTVKNLGVFASFLVLALMVVAGLSSRAIMPLPPALQSWWLPIHASITILADGFLALACIGGIMYLLQEREIKKKRFGLFYSRLPSLEALDKLNHHCLSVGFPCLLWAWSPARFGQNRRGARIGIGILRKPGHLSPGFSTPQLCTNVSPWAGEEGVLLF